MDSHNDFNTRRTATDTTEGAGQYGNFTTTPHGLPLPAPVEPSYHSPYYTYAGTLPVSASASYGPTMLPTSDAVLRNGAFQDMPAQQVQFQEDTNFQPPTDTQTQELHRTPNGSEDQVLIPSPPAAGSHHGGPGNGDDNTGKPFGLHFTSYLEAASHVFRRQLLNLLGDDVGVVEGNAAYWVYSIMLALQSNEFVEPPATTDKKGMKPLDDAQRARWINWQQNAHDKLSALLSLQHGPEQAEARAWRLFNEVMIIHATSGMPRGYRLCPLQAQLNIKCSERLVCIINNLQKYTILRHNLVNDDDYHFFAIAPNDFADQRIRQMWSNYIRDGKKKPGDPTINSRKAAQEDGLGRAARRTMTKGEIAEKKKQLAQQKKNAKRTAGDAFNEDGVGESELEGMD